MTTAGAPYHAGDPILVNGEEAEVVDCYRLPEPQPFGRRWALSIRVGSMHFYGVAACDDDGHDYTKNHRVRPSMKVMA